MSSYFSSSSSRLIRREPWLLIRSPTMSGRGSCTSDTPVIAEAAHCGRASAARPLATHGSAPRAARRRYRAERSDGARNLADVLGRRAAASADGVDAELAKRIRPARRASSSGVSG